MDPLKTGEEKILTQKIKAKVLNSNRYSVIYPPTVERIVEAYIDKYPTKKVEKEVKKTLHQIWGAFTPKSGYEKVLSRILNADLEHISTEGLEEIFLMHQSTKERIGFIESFYNEVLVKLGDIETVVDYGAGLMPLAYALFKGSSEIIYTGLEIDSRLVNFNNRLIKLVSKNDQNFVEMGDPLCGDLIRSDLTFLLKYLPLVKHQSDISELDFLHQIPSRYIVVSFPKSSISGKDKGMYKTYIELMNEITAKTGWSEERIHFENELVYIIDKHS
jgi:16S rRNA (guanine(1405)-N(7))-methyltransferase